MALEHLGWEPEDESQAIEYYIACWEWDEVRRFGSAAIEPLLAFIQIASWHRKCAVVSVLGELSELGDERMVPALISILDNENEIDYVQLLVIETLGKLGDRKAVQPLKNVLKCRNRHLRDAARSALYRIHFYHIQNESVDNKIP